MLNVTIAHVFAHLLELDRDEQRSRQPAKGGHENNAPRPQPENVFLLIGNEDGDRELLTGDDDEWTTYWHGSMGIRAGDLAMMWGRGRNGGMLAFARVVREAYDNPFFSYHTQVGIRSICKTPRLSFKELENLPKWADSTMIRAHLQNCSGRAISREMYEDLLSALEKKGFECSPLPNERSYPTPCEISNERDVEVHLLEPLLQKVGIRETEWRRQLPLRMGRGDRVYPDYAFDVEGKYGEESASLIVEAKYRISNNRDLLEAFRQASSYAMRLGAKGVILCAVEGLWFFERIGRFDVSRSKRFSWSEASSPEKVAVIGTLVRGLRSARK